MIGRTMTDGPDILDEVISWLEKEKRLGRSRIRLSPEAKCVFAESATPGSAGARTGGVPAAPRPPAKSAPAPGGTPGGSGRDAHAPVVTATPSHRHTVTPVPAAALETPPDLSTPDISAHTLETLPAVVAACTRCPLHAQGRTKTVFADGSPKARLMFIGEGPGADEDAQGVPFVGTAGQLLTKMIQAMRLRREEVYIANIVKCRPPGNRNPEEDEARACLPYLQRQIELVKPEVIVVLGAVPFLHLLGRKGIMAGRGQWYDYRGIPVMATYHPAFLLRTPAKKADVWVDLQMVMKRLGIQ
jgi:DNA polymerase